MTYRIRILIMLFYDGFTYIKIEKFNYIDEELF